MKYSCIIWDWNGTLLDDTEICMECVNDMLAKRNMPLLDIARYRSYVDTPIIRFYENVFDLNQVPFDTIVGEFTHSYGCRKATASLFPGSREILEKISSAGIRQIILSAANQNEIESFLSRFALEKYFDAVLGASDFRAESKTERAQNFFEKYEKGKRLVIGDTTHDFETAQALDADCILFSGGHQNRSTLEKTGARIIESLEELSDLTDLF